jgi:hypothetical protein
MKPPVNNFTGSPENIPWVEPDSMLYSCTELFCPPLPSDPTSLNPKGASEFAIIITS